MAMLRIIFLGTSSARPTVSRSTSAIALQREGDLFLFDCGEGTQRQMMKYGVGFTVREIYLTHLHADHYLGAIGLLKTMSLQGREEPLTIYTPPGRETALRTTMELELTESSFPIEITGLAPGPGVRHESYSIRAFEVSHPGGANGYALIEDERPGRFFPEKALELGVPEGPLFGRLQGGETVELDDGREVRPQEVMGPARPGRAVVFTGDTRPCEGTVRIAAGCDLLIHEATFSEEEAERAERTGHSTARGAAEVAKRAGVGRLVLTHLSARYSERAYVLEREARRAGAADVVVAYDGLRIEVPLRDDAVRI